VRQFTSTASVRNEQNCIMETTITAAQVPGDMQEVRALFLEYATWLGEDLCFQGFEAELAGLPGDYAGKRGALLVAWKEREAAGCIALRPFDADTGEIKRLYVRPPFRGSGLGKRLALRVLDTARQADYRRLVLDTLERMDSAVRLYEKLGFKQIPAYYVNPIRGALYFELLMR
jgi:putative acetyltransferase